MGHGVAQREFIKLRQVVMSHHHEKPTSSKQPETGLASRTEPARC